MALLPLRRRDDGVAPVEGGKGLWTAPVERPEVEQILSWGNWWMVTGWGPQDSVPLPYFSGSNGRYNELVTGSYFMVYKPTYIWAVE